uniref:(northern house mosquito) hypothetical protein n=1 Tax=Culex pipiens TaxID=7175 RepID=A0A8D8J460_CULPI
MSYNNLHLRIPCFAVTVGTCNTMKKKKKSSAESPAEGSAKGSAESPAQGLKRKKAKKQSTVGGSASLKSRKRLLYDRNVTVLVMWTLGKEWVKCRIGNRFGKIRNHHLVQIKSARKVFPTKYMGRTRDMHWFCSLCGMEFNIKEDFNTHVLKYYMGKCNLKPKCNKCSYVFNDQATYNAHKESSCLNRIEQKRRVCNLCQKRFVLRNSLVVHERKNKCYVRVIAVEGEGGDDLIVAEPTVEQDEPEESEESSSSDEEENTSDRDQNHI